MNPENYQPLDKIYCGPKVMAAFENKLLHDQEKHTFLLRCLDFYIEAAHQIYQRFLFNSPEVKALKYLTFLCPQNVKTINSICPAAANFPHLINNINNLDRE